MKRSFTRRAMGFLVFILLLLTALPSLAADLSILTEEYPPFNYTDEGKITGISTELVRELLKRVDHPDTIAVASWTEGYNKTLSGENYMLFSTTRTPQRESLFKWVGPIIPNTNVFFARKGSGLRIATLDDARTVKKIGVYKDDVGEQILQAKAFTNLDSVVDNRKNVSKLAAGEIDLWIANEPTGLHMIREAGLEGEIEKVFTVQEEFMYLAFSPTTPDETIQRWQVALDTMKRDGTYAAIFDRWYMFTLTPEIAAIKLHRSLTVAAIKNSAYAKAGKKVLTEAYKRIGFAITFEEMSGQGALDASNAGVVDAELQRIDSIAKDYPNLVQVSIPINYWEGATFIKGKEIRTSGWDSLWPYHLGIVNGIIFIEEATLGMNITSYDTYEELAHSLSQGVVDIAVMPRLSGEAVIKRMGYEEILESGTTLEMLFLYHYVHKKNSMLIPKLEKELKRMLLDGTIRRYRNLANKQLRADHE